LSACRESVLVPELVEAALANADEGRCQRDIPKTA